MVGRSDCARCGRLTIVASRLPTPLRPPIDTGAGDRGGGPPPSFQWWRRLSAVERVLTRWSSGRGESNLRTRTKSPLPQISHLSVKSHSGIAPDPSFQPRVGSESGRTLGWCACTVAPLLRHCCGGDVCWRPAISLPAQSNVVGEVGRCEGVRWREVGVGVLRTGPVAAGVRVYISVGHL